MCADCGGDCAVSLHPKRHLVMRRNWGLSPQDHAIEEGRYHKNMSPQQFGQLQSTDTFNHGANQ